MVNACLRRLAQRKIQSGLVVNEHPKGIREFWTQYHQPKKKYTIVAVISNRAPVSYAATLKIKTSAKRIKFPSPLGNENFPGDGEIYHISRACSQ